MRTRFDAIVIGAGPAGSTAAILLAQSGWSVALIEKQTFPRRKVCGECIAATNLPLFDALGVGAAFAAIAGPPLRRVALWAGARSVSTALPALDGAEYPWGRALGREHLDDMLLVRARRAGACVFQPCAARSLGGESGDFRCAIGGSGSSPSVTLSAPVAIAAHGSWAASPGLRPESSRRSPPRRGRPFADLIAFKANFIGARLEPGLLPVLSFRGGYGGIVVAEQDRTTLACCIDRDRLRALRRESPDEAAGAVVEACLKRECAGVGAALDGATRVGAWLSTGAVQPGIRLIAGDGGAFLVGNAAGEAHPLIGEGISMAIQSAWLLCELLMASREVLSRGSAGQRAQREIHARYAAKWHAQFGARLRMASLLAHIAMHPGLSAAALRLNRVAPAVLARCAHWSGKVRGLSSR